MKFGCVILISGNRCSLAFNEEVLDDKYCTPQSTVCALKLVFFGHEVALSLYIMLYLLWAYVFLSVDALARMTISFFLFKLLIIITVIIIIDITDNFNMYLNRDDNDKYYVFYILQTCSTMFKQLNIIKIFSLFRILFFEFLNILKNHIFTLLGPSLYC